MSKYPKRNFNSVLAEWSLKVALLFFVTSVFFDDNAMEFAKENGGSLSIFTYLKFALIIAFGIVISAISQASFKIVGFTTIIVGSFYKILVLISVDTFCLANTINLADEILLIAVSFFYLYRHHRHEKKAKKESKKTRKSKP